MTEPRPSITPRGISRRSRLTAPRLRQVLLALTLVLAPVVALAGTAGAHDDEGVMTVTKAEQSGPTTVHIEVGIVYEGDEHLAEDAKVSAVLTGADGSIVGPSDLPRVSDDSSLYAADIEVGSPGTWAAAVTSTEPNASQTASVDVVAEASPDTSDSTTSTLLDEEEGDQIFTTQGAEDGNGSTDSSDSSDGDGEEDGMIFGALLVTGLIVVVVALAVGGTAIVRRRGAGSEHDHTHDGPPPPDQMPPDRL